MHILKLAAAAAFAVAAGSANATIYTVFDDLTGGVADFNATVTGAGAVATADQLSALAAGTSIDRGAYSISRNNGGYIYDNGVYSSGGVQTSGSTIDISPAGSGPGIGAIGSGITFTFDTAVNAIGFEVGDWGTCCQPSALFISFDDGAPIQVGLSTVWGDVFLTDNQPVVFVAAFDDSGSFSKVQFWGDGFGEYLVAGGTVRYALLDEGTLPPVPEPATWALFISGFGLVGLAARRRRALSAA